MTLEQNSTPSRDPSNSGTMAGTLRHAYRFFLKSTDSMLPAIVDTYDRENNVVAVRPVIQMVGTSGELVSRAGIASVPVLSMGGGGFHINFPIKKGDLGWIMASDRDISNFTQSLTESSPNTDRFHSFEDALFIPDVFRNYTIKNEDADRMVIQSTSSDVRITLSDDQIKLKSAKIRILADSDISIQAPIININGDIITTGTITNDDKDIGSTHTHGGIRSGSSRTTEPNDA